MQAHTGITGNTWPGSGSELATYRVDTIGYDANLPGGMAFGPA